MDVKGPAKENQDFEFSAYLFSVGPAFFENMPLGAGEKKAGPNGNGEVLKSRF